MTATSDSAPYVPRRVVAGAQPGARAGCSGAALGGLRDVRNPCARLHHAPPLGARRPTGGALRVCAMHRLSEYLKALGITTVELLPVNAVY